MQHRIVGRLCHFDAKVRVAAESASQFERVFGVQLFAVRELFVSIFERRVATVLRQRVPNRAVDRTLQLPAAQTAARAAVAVFERVRGRSQRGSRWQVRGWL